jgi:class 3 adenylate cyclase
MDSASRDRPSGTVTFLFTDVEVSTALWEEDADAMAASLRMHDEIMRSSIEGHGGYVFSTAGDACCAAFGRASQGVEAALAAQSGLPDAVWPGPRLRVRMGLHTGVADERDGDDFGIEVNRAARLMSAGHAGQVLLSGVTAGLVRTQRDDLVDLGEHRLKDLSHAESAFNWLLDSAHTEADSADLQRGSRLGVRRGLFASCTTCRVASASSSSS